MPFTLFDNFNAIPECSAFATPWVFRWKVPAGQPVHVTIQIFDEDTFFDDEADLKPGSGNAINQRDRQVRQLDRRVGDRERPDR